MISSECCKYRLRRAVLWVCRSVVLAALKATSDSPQGVLSSVLSVYTCKLNKFDHQYCHSRPHVAGGHIECLTLPHSHYTRVTPCHTTPPLAWPHLAMSCLVTPHTFIYSSHFEGDFFTSCHCHPAVTNPHTEQLPSGGWWRGTPDAVRCHFYLCLCHLKAMV